MIACLKLQMFRRLLIYSAMMFVIVALMDLNLSNLAYDLIQAQVARAGSANIDLGALSLRILSNSILAQLASIAVITICCISLSVFWRLLKVHNPIYRQYLVFIAVALTIYFAYNTNAVWHLTAKPLLEAHFTKITYHDQIDAIEIFNGLKPDDAQLTASIEQLRKDRSLHFLDDCTGLAHCINNTTLNISFVLYWLAYFLLSTTAFIGLAAASTVFAPRPAGVHDEVGDASVRAMLLDEYRSRCDTLRLILYFGSTTLLVGILWLYAHSSWAVKPLLAAMLTAGNGQPHLAYEVFFTSYRTYMTIFYSMILMIGFVPGVLNIRGKAHTLFKQERGAIPIEKRGNLTFDSWLVEAYLPAKILNVKDLAFLLAPMASLLVGSNLTDTFTGLTSFFG